MSVGSRLLLPVIVELVYCCLHTLRGHTYVFFFFTAHHGEVQQRVYPCSCRIISGKVWLEFHKKRWKHMKPAWKIADSRKQYDKGLLLHSATFILFLLSTTFLSKSNWSMIFLVEFNNIRLSESWLSLRAISAAFSLIWSHINLADTEVTFKSW